MKKLQINKEHKALIESVIRESAKYKGNEELIDIICESIYKKSYLLIDAIKDMPRLRRHLSMICDGCIDSVIKEKKKFEAIRAYSKKPRANMEREIVSLKKHVTLQKEDDLEHEFSMQRAKREIVNLKEEIKKSELYNGVDLLVDPLEFCPQKRISENTVSKLVQVVKNVDSKFPKKRYYEIFSLRYIRRYNQTQIAREMRISQVELSKRFVEMIKLARETV